MIKRHLSRITGFVALLVYFFHSQNVSASTPTCSEATRNAIIRDYAAFWSAQTPTQALELYTGAARAEVEKKVGSHSAEELVAAMRAYYVPPAEIDVVECTQRDSRARFVFRGKLGTPKRERIQIFLLSNSESSWRVSTQLITNERSLAALLQRPDYSLGPSELMPASIGAGRVLKVVVHARTPQNPVMATIIDTSGISISGASSFKATDGRIYQILSVSGSSFSVAPGPDGYSPSAHPGQELTRDGNTLIAHRGNTGR